MAIEKIKWPSNRPNVHYIHQHLALQHSPKCSQKTLQDSPKRTQNFGLKISHLATLVADERG
jgi:hypothetical protein